MPRDEIAGRLPFIVTGTGRSGTSTVAWTLHNSGVFMGPIIEGDTEDPEFRLWNSLRMRAAVDEDQWRIAISSLADHRFRTQTYWGFKDPRSSCYIADLYQLFPHATFIRCVRNRDDVVRSLMAAYNVGREIAEGAHDQRAKMLDDAPVDWLTLGFESIKDGSFIDLLPVPVSRVWPANLSNSKPANE